MLRARCIYLQTHIDSISPTSRQTEHTTSCGLDDLDDIWNDAAVDLLHLPVILPGKREGLVLGVWF